MKGIKIKQNNWSKKRAKHVENIPPAFVSKDSEFDGNE